MDTVAHVGSSVSWNVKQLVLTSAVLVFGTFPANSDDYIIKVDADNGWPLGHVAFICCALTDAPSYETGA
jgi:hypothetical protein